MTDTEAAVPALTYDQRARVAALEAARQVLRTTNAFQVKPGDVTDLHSLADYILSGEDPWRKPYLAPEEGSLLGGGVPTEARPSCTGTCEGVPCNGVECPPKTRLHDDRDCRYFGRTFDDVSPSYGDCSCKAKPKETVRITPPEVAVNAVLDALQIELERLSGSSYVAMLHVKRAIDEARPAPV